MRTKKTIMELEARKVRVFRNRNFALLFYGILVSNVAFILFSFAISYFLLRTSSTTFGEAKATLIQSAYVTMSGVVLLILTPLGGVLADRWNKAKIMYVTDFIRGATILTAGIIVTLNHSLTGDLITLFAMNLILAANQGIFGPASSSLLRFVVTDEELQSASSYLQGSSNLQSILGLVLCGIVYANVDIFWIFVFTGIAYLISATTEVFIRYNQPKNDEKITMKAVLADSRDGLKYLVGSKGILTVLVMALFLNFFFNPIFSVGFPNFIQFGLSAEPSYLFQTFLSPTAWVSLIEIVFSISAIVMALVLSAQPSREKQGKRLKVVLGIMVIPSMIMAVVLSLYYKEVMGINAILLTVTACMMLMGFTNVAFNVPFGLVIQRQVDRKMLGKVNSVSNVIAMGLTPISSLIGGLIISGISASALYVFCAVGILVTSAWYILNPRANEL